jgi:hypothetical protein
MAKRKKSRLSTGEIERIDAALRELHDVLPDIETLRECGEDCSELLAAHAEAERSLTTLKEKFG